MELLLVKYFWPFFYFVVPRSADMLDCSLSLWLHPFFLLTFFSRDVETELSPLDWLLRFPKAGLEKASVEESGYKAAYRRLEC